MQDESVLADRIGAPISARLAELQSAAEAAAASNSTAAAAGAAGGLSAVPDLLFGNKDFLDEFLDVSDCVDSVSRMMPLLCELYFGILDV